MKLKIAKTVVCAFAFFVGLCIGTAIYFEPRKAMVVVGGYIIAGILFWSAFVVGESEG